MSDDFTKAVRESKVEASRKQHVVSQGGLFWKFTSPGLIGVPDRIELYGVDALMEMTGYTREACVSMLAACVQFTECKAPGRKPDATQLRRHAELRALGFTVNIIDQP